MAIKLAHPASGGAGGDMEHLVREFSREVAAMSALPPHKNVLQLLAACTVPPQLALITEYCPAGSLYQLLHSPLPSPTSPSPGLGGSGGGATPPPSPGSLPHLLGVCLGVAQGMAWLHHHNILHRDLKSANILLDGAGNARIADFGLAKIYSGRQVGCSSLCAQCTVPACDGWAGTLVTGCSFSRLQAQCVCAYLSA